MPVYYSNQEIPGSPDSRFRRKSSGISKRGHEENLAGDPDTNHTLAEQEEFPGDPSREFHRLQSTTIITCDTETHHSRRGW